MFCDQCGTALRDGQRFCHSCGKSFQAAAPPPAVGPPPPSSSARGRVVKHAGILGVLWIVWSFLHFFPAVLWTFIGWAGMPRWFHNGPGFFRPAFISGHVLGGLSGFLMLCTIAGIVAGVAMISYKPWARALLLVLGCLALVSIPFGTILGIYTLWVLLPRESEQELNNMSAAR